MTVFSPRCRNICQDLVGFQSDSWWRHQRETFIASLAICAGNSPVSGEFPTQRPVTRSIDLFFDLRLNKRLSKQWWDWCFETLSCPLWRQCNVVSISKTLIERGYNTRNGRIVNGLSFSAKSISFSSKNECKRFHYGHQYTFVLHYEFGSKQVSYLQTTQENMHFTSIQSHWTKPLHDDVIKWKHFMCYWPFV